MKNYWLSLVLVLSLLGIQQITNAQTATEILWQTNRKLTWADFKAPPAKGHKASALTNASMQFYLQQEGNVIKIDTRVFFRTDGSWVKPNAHQDNLLQHEQTHFDIHELFARKFRKYIDEVNKNLPPQKMVDKMAKRFKKIKKQSQNYQKKYDKQTNFSRNLPQQKTWTQSVNNQLKALEKFAHPFVDISLN